jgi:hypothetical protein
MMYLSNNAIQQMLFQAAILCFFIFGIIGVAVGAGLIVCRDKVFKISQTMNHWVSTRHVLKPAEIPRDTEQMSHKYRRWVGAIFILGGVFSIFGLIARVDAAAIGAALKLGNMLPFAVWLMESLRWFLIAGSLLGIAVGIMLCFYPNALGAIEKFANQWISSRHITRGGDDMRMTLDRVVEAYPRPSGWIIACGSLGVVIYSAVLLLTRSFV